MGVARPLRAGGESEAAQWVSRRFRNGAAGAERPASSGAVASPAASWVPASRPPEAAQSPCSDRSAPPPPDGSQRLTRPFRLGPPARARPAPSCGQRSPAEPLDTRFCGSGSCVKTADLGPVCRPPAALRRQNASRRPRRLPFGAGQTTINFCCKSRWRALREAGGVGMIRKAVLGAMVLMGTNVFVVRGQDDVVSSQLYGQGVHAYFAGDYVQGARVVHGGYRSGHTRSPLLLFPRFGLLEARTAGRSRRRLQSRSTVRNLER